MTITGRILLILSLLVFQAGCSTGNGKRGLLDVPFRIQEGNHCGTDALEMVLRYYGVAVDRNTMAEQVFIPALQGTVPDLLACAATEAGFCGRVVRGDVPQLKKWLGMGIPPIVLLGPDNAGDKGHFVVVTGIDGERIVAHSGAGRNRRYKANAFLKRWRAGGFVAVLVSDGGKGHAPEL